MTLTWTSGKATDREKRAAMLKTVFLVDRNSTYSANAGEPRLGHILKPDLALERDGACIDDIWVIQPLSVEGDLESLSDITAYVLDAAKAAGLNRKASYGLRLAVDEIATNIITHGYGEAGDQGRIVVRGSIDEWTLLVSLEDTARPYNPRTQPEPDQLNLSLQEREIGGLGIYLALRNVDDFVYTYIDNKNYNMFIMYRPKGVRG